MGVAVLLVIALLGWNQREGYLTKNIINSYIGQARSKNNCGDVEQCLISCYYSNNKYKNECVNNCAAMQDNIKNKCFKLKQATSTATIYPRQIKKMGYETKYKKYK